MPSQPIEPADNGATRVARKVEEVDEAVREIREVEGMVRLKRELRSCRRERNEDELGGPTDDGPLAGIASKVLSMQILHKSSQATRPGRDRIKVFFYDAWAEALSFILNQKHRLVLTGPGTMVRRNEAAEANDHPFVLVVAPPAVMSMEPRVLRSRTHLSSSGPVLSVKICDEERGRELAITDPEDPDLQQQIDHFVRPGAAQGGRGRAGTRAGGAGGGGGGGGAAPKYAYTKLQDLTEANKHYDVYAVVASFSLPKATSGSDMIMSLLLVDPTSPDPNHGTVCNIFAPEVSKFPPVTRVGDILRCHRVKSQVYQDKMQLVGHKARSQFVVISRASTAPPVPPVEDVAAVDDVAAEEWDDSLWLRQATSNTHTFDEDDQRLVYGLWSWSRHWLLTAQLSNPEYATGPHTVQAVLALQPGATQQAHSDLTVMIMAKTASQLHVWDGTGTAAEGGGSSSQRGPQVPQQLITSVHTAIREAMAGPKWASIAASLELPPTQPLPSREEVAAALNMRQGARLPLRFDADVASRLSHFSLAPGVWVRAKDLQLSTGPDGQTAALLTTKASLNVLPPTAYDVARAAAAFLKRMLQHRKEHGIFAVLMPYRARRLSADPRSAAQGKCVYVAEAAASSTGTFHLQARITGHWPESARQLCQAMPRQQQQQAEEGGRRGRRAAGGAVLEWRFFFEVVLQDETGEIRALVADEAAASMFPGVPACDLGDPANVDQLAATEKALAHLQQPRLQHLVVRSYLLSKRDREGRARHVKYFRVCRPAAASS